jgi:hypothetical protein
MAPDENWTDNTVWRTNDEARKQAKQIFDDLDTYARGNIAVGGTAFTTYEDYGAATCKWLHYFVDQWWRAGGGR